MVSCNVAHKIAGVAGFIFIPNFRAFLGDLKNRVGAPHFLASDSVNCIDEVPSFALNYAW